MVGRWESAQDTLLYHTRDTVPFQVVYLQIIIIIVLPCNFDHQTQLRYGPDQAIKVAGIRSRCSRKSTGFNVMTTTVELTFDQTREH